MAEGSHDTGASEKTDGLQSLNAELDILARMLPGKRASVKRVQAVAKVVLANASRSTELLERSVKAVEKFVSMARPHCRLAGLYVVDAVCRHEQRHKHMLATPQFQLHIEDMVFRMKVCSEDDRRGASRLLNEWQKHGVFAAKNELLAKLADELAPDKQSVRLEETQPPPPAEPQQPRRPVVVVPPTVEPTVTREPPPADTSYVHDEHDRQFDPYHRADQQPQGFDDSFLDNDVLNYNNGAYDNNGAYSAYNDKRRNGYETYGSAQYGPHYSQRPPAYYSRPQDDQIPLKPYGGGAGVEKPAIPKPPANPALLKTRMCRSAEQGVPCRFGDQCSFAHSLAELRQSMPSSAPPPQQQPQQHQQPQQQPQQQQQQHQQQQLQHTSSSTTKWQHHLKKTKLCRHFVQGACPFGDRCNFAHGEADVRSPQHHSPANGPPGHQQRQSEPSSQYQHRDAVNHSIDPQQRRTLPHTAAQPPTSFRLPTRPNPTSALTNMPPASVGSTHANPQMPVVHPPALKRDFDEWSEGSLEPEASTSEFTKRPRLAL